MASANLNALNVSLRKQSMNKLRAVTFGLDPDVEKWHRRFLGLAEYVSQWSKDVSTKVGAVILDSDKRVVSLGYNGFARGVMDTAERLNCRDLKYKMIVHAERNAIIFARQDLRKCTI